MRNRLAMLAASLAVVLSVGTLPATATEVLRVGGTGAGLAMLTHLGGSFTQRTGITVAVVSNLGSSGGLNALAEGVLDLAVSGRTLKPTELASGLVQVATMRTPYVLASSHPAPLGFTRHEVTAAYTAERAVWPDGAPLRIILRPRADADTPLLAALFPGMEAALNQARHRGDAPVAATDQDNADLAERLPGSLTGMSYTQVALERRNLRLVPLDSVVPTLEAFESGAYPHGKVLRLIQPRQPSAAAERFVQFLRTDEGVLAMREAFCLPDNR